MTRYVKYEENDVVTSAEVRYQNGDEVGIIKHHFGTEGGIKKTITSNQVIKFYEDEDPDLPDNNFF